MLINLAYVEVEVEVITYGVMHSAGKNRSHGTMASVCLELSYLRVQFLQPMSSATCFSPVVPPLFLIRKTSIFCCHVYAVVLPMHDIEHVNHG